MASSVNGDINLSEFVGEKSENGDDQHARVHLRRKPSITNSRQQLERRREERKHSRVKFKEGESLTDSCPPRSPSKEGEPKTSMSVVEKYSAVCLKSKIKPLPRVIAFLKRVEDFSIRQPVFDLKGVRLDSRQCEALEEVFRWIQVDTLVLDGCGLEDEGLMALMEMMEFYECACRVVMSNNNRIRRPAWLAMSRMLKKSPFIHFLDVSQSATDLHAVPLLGRALRVNCGLSTLHLERNGISGARTVILAASLKVNTNLTHLYLGNNQLVVEDAAMLSALLRSNKTLQLLDLRDNNLQDSGVVMLCQALAEQVNGLGALVLWNNRCTQESISPLCHMLAVHKTLHTIELGRNRLCQEDGMDSLKQGFLASSSLANVGLMEVGLNVQGAVALAEYVALSQCVQHINVRRNDIRVGGLLALARALNFSKTLTRLDMDQNIRVDQQQDHELVRSLMELVAESTFRNVQLAAEAALRQQQEEAMKSAEGNQEETADASDAQLPDSDSVSEHGVRTVSSDEDREDKHADPMERPEGNQAGAGQTALPVKDVGVPGRLFCEQESFEGDLAETDREHHISADNSVFFDSDKSNSVWDDDGGDDLDVPSEDSTADEETSSRRTGLFSPVVDSRTVQFEEELAAALEELTPNIKNDSTKQHVQFEEASFPSDDLSAVSTIDHQHLDLETGSAIVGEALSPRDVLVDEMQDTKDLQGDSSDLAESS